MGKAIVSEREYWEAIEELIGFCEGSRYKDDIVAIYLGGSVARGDFSPGRSDIDIYMVARASKEGMEAELEKVAKRIAKERLARLLEVHQEPIGVTVTTVSEVRAGKSFLAAGFEYHNFMKTGRLLWGQDIKPLIPKPSREEERTSAGETLKEMCALFQGQLNRWARTRALRKICVLLAFLTKTKEKLTYQLFAAIFRTACIALCGEGRYVSGKGEAVAAFREVYPQEYELHEVLSQSFALWKEWERRALTYKELQRLMGLSRKFISRVCELWGVSRQRG